MADAWASVARPRPTVFTAPPPESRPQPLVQWFVVFLLGCQVTLLVPGIGGARVLVRVAAFGVSLVLLALVKGKAPRHSAYTLTCATM